MSQREQGRRFLRSDAWKTLDFSATPQALGVAPPPLEKDYALKSVQKVIAEGGFKERRSWCRVSAAHKQPEPLGGDTP